MSATFRSFARSHGLHCTYHSLRHTTASLMLATGTDLRTIAGRLGLSATTTLATYSHLIGQADRDAAERPEALLSRSPGWQRVSKRRVFPGQGFRPDRYYIF
jgi:site-specific recombinase XerC